MKYLPAFLGAFLFAFGMLWFVYENTLPASLVDAIVWLPAIVCMIVGFILVFNYVSEQANRNK